MQPTRLSSPSVDSNAYLPSIQTIEQPKPTQPLSKTEQVEAICTVYQKLIELEERREAQPFRTEVKEYWTYAHHVDGSVITIITKEYHIVSDFSSDDYQQELEELTKKLEELDTYRFLENLSDDLESLTRISTLCGKWGEFILKNQGAFDLTQEELEKIKAADSKIGFKE